MLLAGDSALNKPSKTCGFQNSTAVDQSQAGRDCSCLAQTHAAPDFAGPAVIASFLFIAWLTIAVAAIPTIRSIWNVWLRSSNTKGPNRVFWWLRTIIQFEQSDAIPERTSLVVSPNQSDHSHNDAAERGIAHSSDALKEGQASNWPSLGSSDPQSDASQPLPSSRQYNNIEPEPPSCIFARRILLQLCDLQIIYGIAICISALAQLKSLSFYHLQFAQQFWWMTLNSIWISRIDYTRNTPDVTTWRAHARRTSIWTSVALSLVLQSFVTYQERYLWNPTVQGRCYIRDDAGSSFAQNLFWLCGTGLYFVMMSFSMTPWTRKWVDEKINDRVGPSVDAMHQWAHQAYINAVTGKVTIEAGDASLLKRVFVISFLYIEFVSYTVLWLVWWALLCFLSIWVAGNTAAVIGLVVYSIFAGLSTWWIIFLKVNNRQLIVGDENQFTYGQSLPLVLLLLICFHALDVWAGVQNYVAGQERRDKIAPSPVIRPAVNLHPTQDPQPFLIDSYYRAVPPLHKAFSQKATPAQ